MKNKELKLIEDIIGVFENFYGNADYEIEELLKEVLHIHHIDCNQNTDIALNNMIAERDRMLTIAANAIELGQLNELYSEATLKCELGMSDAEYTAIMEK